MEHLKNIVLQLTSYHLDGMLITSESNEYYALGFHGEGVLLVTSFGNYYSTDSRYVEAARRQIQGAEVLCIGPGNSHLQLLSRRLEELGIRHLGIEEESISLAEAQKLQSVLPHQTHLVPAQALMHQLRASKDREELERIRHAQSITDDAFTEILNHIRPGMTEQDVAARLVYLMMSKGARRVSFDPIVVAGPNSSMPHGIPGTRRIERGDFVTMDFGCVVDGYCSDMTRTVCVGFPTNEMVKVYNTVLDAQKAGIEMARVGVTGAQIHSAAMKVIRDAGYGEYFGHSFGHGLGIEIHEAPNASPSNHDPMPVGAMISAEPGIYLPGRFGVRIEDILYLTEDGAVDLTASSKELIMI